MADNQSESIPSFPEGETPSPLCNHLLEQAKLRRDGDLSEEDLVAAVQQALESLGDAREQTLGNLEETEAAENVFEAFDASFDDMQVALEQLLEFASQAEDDEAYENIREFIFRAALSSTAAMAAMSRSEMSEGPTDMPLFNSLFQMKESFLKGGVESGQLTDALAGIVEMTRAAVKELMSAEGEQPSQRDGLVAAYEAQIANLERAEQQVAAGQRDELEETFEALLATSNAVKEAMGSLTEAKMGAGPCRLRRTNVLLSALKSLQSGGLAVTTFLKTLESYEGEILEERTRFEQLAATPGQSDIVASEVSGVAEAYELHEEALGILAEFAEGEMSLEDCAKGEALLIEASEKLSDHKEKLVANAEEEGKVSCVRCGARNEPTSKVCSSCGAQLPQVAGAVSSTMSFQESNGSHNFGAGELEMTENLERLFLAVNAIAEQEISDEEFEDVLVWMDGLLADALSTMPDVPTLPNHPDLPEEQKEHIASLEEELTGQRNMMLQGMSDFRVALGSLQAFFESRDDDDLRKGVGEVRDAALKMQQSEKELTDLMVTIENATKAQAESQAAEATETDQEVEE